MYLGGDGQAKRPSKGVTGCNVHVRVAKVTKAAHTSPEAGKRHQATIKAGENNLLYYKLIIGFWLLRENVTESILNYGTLMRPQ